MPNDYLDPGYDPDEIRRFMDEERKKKVDQPSGGAAFGVYPSSGKGRKYGPVSRALDTGQAQTALAKGLTMMPQNLAGMPVDLINLALTPLGLASEKPVMGSDWLKEQSRRAGLAFAEPQDPTLGGFFTAGDIASNLINPVAATRSVASGAGKVAGAVAPKAAEMAEGYLQASGLAPTVIKPKGGNWLTGDIEKQTERLKHQGVAVMPLNEAELADYTRQGYTQFDPTTGTYSKPDAVNQWIDKKLNKYIRNEMGTPEDPVRALAERGILHFEPQQVFGDAPSTLMRKRAGAGMPTPLFGQSEMARRWESLADRAIDPFPAGSYKYGALDESFLASNPWLEKVPDEAMVYKAKGLRRDMGFDHLIDELRNAIRPNSDLPARLRWKPEDLQKVTMEQAVRRVHEINEYRAAKKAEANEVLARNPATAPYRDYDTIPGTDQPNEKGLAWKQIKNPEPVLEGGYRVVKDEPFQSNWQVVPHPEGDGFALRAANGEFASNLNGTPERKWATAEQARADISNYADVWEPDPDELYKLIDPAGNVLARGKTESKVLSQLKRDEREKALADALKYEGDVMGHCVGGYCDDVLSGQSQIFSLRDKKGEPHVTIEVRAPDVRVDGNTPLDFWRENKELVGEPLPQDTMQQVDFNRKIISMPEFREWLNNRPSDIVQIKGKGNRAPNAEYLPFVQDFVRSGNWSRVGDFNNTGLFRKIDFIDEFTPAQLDSIGKGEYLTMNEIKKLRENKNWKPIDTDPDLDVDFNLLRAKGGEVHAAGGGLMEHLDPGYEPEVIRRKGDTALDLPTTNLTAQERDLAPRRRPVPEAPLAQATALNAPSMRERHAAGAEKFLRTITPRAGSIAGAIFGGEKSPLPLGLGLADFPVLSPYLPEEAGFMVGQGAGTGSAAETAMGAGLGALSVLPFAKPAATAVKAAGKAVAPTVGQMAEGYLQSTGLAPSIVARPNQFGFFSAAEEAALTTPRKSGPGQGFLNDLRKAGVSKNELEPTGIAEFLQSSPNVTREEVQQFVKQNKPDVQVKVLSDPTRHPNQDLLGEHGLKYDHILDQITPLDRPLGEYEGGKPHTFSRWYDNEGYKESPEYRQWVDEIEELGQEIYRSMPKFDEPTLLLPGGSNYREVSLNLRGPEMHRVPSPHSLGGNDTDINRLAHVRMNDRVDADGKKVLFIEELQSDWGQEGKKKGFRGKPAIEEKDGRFFLKGSGVSFQSRKQAEAFYNERNAGVSFAPFVTKTNDWVDLGLKHIMKMAADEGYSKVAFINGTQSADRYDLSKRVDQLLYKKNDDGTYKISAQAGGRGNMIGERISEDKLADYVGKDIADKIVSDTGIRINLGGSSASQPEDMWGSLSGQGLKVGGEGMKDFYDKIVPGQVNALLKKFGGGKLGDIQIPTEGGVLTQPGFDITPELRKKLAEPMSYAEGGAVNMADTIAQQLQSSGMDADKALMHALRMQAAKDAEPVTVSPRPEIEGAEDFKQAVMQKFAAGGIAKIGKALAGKGGKKEAEKAGASILQTRAPEEQSVIDKFGQKQTQEAARAKKVGKMAAQEPTEPAKPAKSRRPRAKVEPDIYRKMAAEQGDEAVLRAARAGEHLKPTPGGYVGAPRTVTSGQGLGAMRRSMDKDFADSVEAVRLADPERLGTWYDRAKRGIAESNEPYQIDRSLEQHGVYSAGVSPESELAFALKHLNSRVAGEPSMAYRGAPMRNLDTAVAENRPANMGFKIGEYANKNDPRIPNEGLFGVNDFRRAQGMGYTDPQGNPWKAGVSETMHPFMDAETALQVDRANKAGIGGRTDWAGPHIQEVPWVYGKAQDLYALSKEGRFKGDELEGIKGALQQANNTARDYFYKHAASATHEAVPGARLGHVPQVLKMGPAEKLEYGRTGRWDMPPPEYALGEYPQVGAGNRDIIYGAAGYRQLPSREASGLYINSLGGVETNPMTIARPLMDYPTGGGGLMAPESRRMADTLEQFRAFIDAQEAGAYNLPNTMAATKGKNSMVFDTRGRNPDKLGDPSAGVLPTSQQLSDINDAIMRHTPVGPDGTKNPQFTASATNRGVVVFPYDPSMSSKDASKFLNKVKKDIVQIYPSDVQKSMTTTGYVPGIGKRSKEGPLSTAPYSGEAISDLLRAFADLPQSVAMNIGESEAIREAIRQKALRDSLMGGTRGDIQESRRFFSEADWPKAVEMIRKGMSPAAALAALGYSASSMAGERQ